MEIFRQSSHREQATGKQHAYLLASAAETSRSTEMAGDFEIALVQSALSTSGPDRQAFRV